MTDDEKLIEEAAKAIYFRADEIGLYLNVGPKQAEALARAALAVFEKALTPATDEQEAITDEALWDFAGDLLDAWNIEDLKPPGLIEQFRDRFVARFGYGSPQGEPSDAQVNRDYLAHVIHKAVYSRIPLDRLTDEEQADTYKRADAVLVALRAANEVR